MTLCIAAACQDPKPRIIVGTDWKVSTEIATAEIQDKLSWINPNTVVLIAGTISRALELKDTFTNYFDHLIARKEETKLRLSHMSDVLKKGVAIYRQKRAHEYVSLTLGMSYADFRKAVGKDEIPESLAKETYQNIARQDLECWLIIATFFERKP